MAYHSYTEINDREKGTDETSVPGKWPGGHKRSMTYWAKIFTDISGKYPSSTSMGRLILLKNSKAVMTLCTTSIV